MIQATAHHVENLWIIVLAAGGSTRLGRPKQLLRVGGQTLLTGTLTDAARISGDRVIAVIGAGAQRMRSHIRRNAPAARCVYNSGWRRGMGASLARGMRAVPRSATAVMILLCDQPKITEHSLRHLMKRCPQCAGRTIVASRYLERNAVPAIFPRSAFRALRRLQGDQGARALLNSRESGFRVITVDLPEAAQDIDTPADAAELLGRL
jgi:molybdenum cofactor cytidylyltransferase